MSFSLFIKPAQQYFVAGLFVLMVVALFRYTGHWYIYLFFSIVSGVLLYCGFRKNSIFFDTFIGVFFLLGFWLKLTFAICFLGGVSKSSLFGFGGSEAGLDQVLLVSLCGMLGLVTASFIRERLLFKYPTELSVCHHSGTIKFYKNHRNAVLICFFILLVFVTLTNIYYGIYQRGEITQSTLPFGLNGIYKWLLLFGLASISTVILRCEFLMQNKPPYLVVFLSLLESFMTNVSMLSRGMILNMTALAYGLYLSVKKYSIRITFPLIVAATIVFCSLFVSSIVVVNQMRTYGYVTTTTTTTTTTIHGFVPLLLDRWVGIEGVMAVSGNPKIGWDLWKEAWKERYSENTMSFYDSNLIDSPYKNTDFTKKHHISLPGIVAFGFYPGSLFFLFVWMLMVGLLAALIEISAFKLGGHNLILCALISEVVAYRFLSFGYVPAQSYLLFGTIFLNLIIIYLIDKFIDAWQVQ